MDSQVGALLVEMAGKGLKLAVAESLTAGLVASTIAQTAGASRVFLGGVVAYDSRVKVSMLGVDHELLKKLGAVSQPVASQMALGVRSSFALEISEPFDKIVGLSTTGVAGPDTQDGAPVGLVFLAVSIQDSVLVREHRFAGDRNSIRQQATLGAIDLLQEALERA